MSAADSITDLIYTSCYCEENAYHLCQRLREHSSDVFVVFVSNPRRQVPFWRQRASQHTEGFTVWDYHVLILQLSDKQYLVWDLDTTLPLPCSFAEYTSSALKPLAVANTDFARLYRVVKADEYLQFFASDRSHMRGQDGSWHAAPPPYPCIVAPDGTQMRLQQYISMTTPAADDEIPTASFLGTVYSETAFLQAFLPSAPKSDADQLEQLAALPTFS